MKRSSHRSHSWPLTHMKVLVSSSFVIRYHDKIFPKQLKVNKQGVGDTAYLHSLLCVCFLLMLYLDHLSRSKIVSDFNLSNKQRIALL